jgi:hypothetical protein
MPPKGKKKGSKPLSQPVLPDWVDDPRINTLNQSQIDFLIENPESTQGVLKLLRKKGTLPPLPSGAPPGFGGTPHNFLFFYFFIFFNGSIYLLDLYMATYVQQTSSHLVKRYVHTRGVILIIPQTKLSLPLMHRRQYCAMKLHRHKHFLYHLTSLPFNFSNYPYTSYGCFFAIRWHLSQSQLKQ